MRAALVLALVVLAGCGSSSDDDATGSFEEDGFGITFEYPKEMNEADKVTIASGAGGAAKATAGIGYGKKDTKDVIIVQRYDLRVAIDEKNLDRARAELDPLVAKLSPGASAGRTGTTRGFPSIDYAGLEVREVPGGETRLVALFDGDTEYLINCQSTPERRADIDKACEQVLKTVEKKN